MLFRSNNSKSVNYEDYAIEVTYTDYNTYTSRTETFTIGKANGYKVDGTNATLILMPGMRFNQSSTKAFQVALAGVININSKGNVTSFPVPMVSWFRKI